MFSTIWASVVTRVQCFVLLKVKYYLCSCVGIIAEGTRLTIFQKHFQDIWDKWY